jgi:hypothetical protein
MIKFSLAKNMENSEMEKSHTTFVVKMVVSNHSSPRIVLEIGSIPIEQMDESHAWISVNF